MKDKSKPWWSLRGKERSAAKAEHEKRFPSKRRNAPHHDKHERCWISKRGHRHEYRSDPECYAAEFLARADSQPLDASRFRVELRWGRVYIVGAHGTSVEMLGDPTAIHATRTLIDFLYRKESEAAQGATAPQSTSATKENEKCQSLDSQAT
jgi:hypothetical protein